MVLGSLCMLTKEQQRKLKLELHWNRETSRVKEARGLAERRARKAQLEKAAELRRTNC